MFGVSQLRELMGKKGKVYIRPVEEFPKESCRSFSDREVRFNKVSGLILTCFCLL